MLYRNNADNSYLLQNVFIKFWRFIFEPSQYYLFTATCFIITILFPVSECFVSTVIVLEFVLSLSRCFRHVQIYFATVTVSSACSDKTDEQEIYSVVENRLIDVLVFIESKKSCDFVSTMVSKRLSRFIVTAELKSMLLLICPPTIFCSRTLIYSISSGFLNC